MFFYNYESIKFWEGNIETPSEGRKDEGMSPAYAPETKFFKDLFLLFAIGILNYLLHEYKRGKDDDDDDDDDEAV
ncbi:hypothetical protein AVEN_80903-1 [Araneus ventricosus]|uniref:Uncharacterized protein n=1 Tax=Araneus ventricosus TaxID=182803 RepID=A0A4Y2DLA9_ARAVE|nr:hypothetical protein AVEN_80903-1 [Araneus ventricosus]